MPPATAPTHAQSTTPTLSRDDVFRLSEQATPWVLLPVVDRAIEADTDDIALALLGVRTLARLGLRSPASERLGALRERLDAAPGADELHAAIEAIPPDVIPLPRRIKMAKRNIEAMTARGEDVGDAFGRWAEGESAWEHLRAAGGNVVRRPAGTEMSTGWRWVGDLRNGMDEFVEKTFRGDDPIGFRQIAIEGANPPWLLLAVHERTRANRFGYAPRLTLVQSDAEEFFEGASVADLRDCISDPRVRIIIGADATDRFRADAMGRMTEQLAGIGMVSNTIRAHCAPGLNAVIREISDAQQAATAALRDRVQEIYSGRDAAWWDDRFAIATAPGGAEPLRVLIPSCRFTTYVQHAAESMRDALRRQGFDARLLIEPNDHANLSEWAYHNNFAEFRPDLVIMTNYTRAERRSCIPAGVPVVCWTQDCMPHLLNGETGAAQGDLDFVVGHVYESMLREFGFRRDRAMRFPVAVDAHVFRPTEFSINGSTGYDAEIAYVSHHSETPGAMLERLIAEDGGGRNEALLRGIAAEIQRLLAGSTCSAFRQPLRRFVADEVARVRPGRDRHEVAARTFHQFAIPLAERLVRHEMLRWAKDTAATHGWRLAIYGKGWDETPEFADQARGPMTHGSALRDCYERSAVQLHASVCNPAHQRVQECVLAGGFPLSRITRDALQVEFELMRLGAMGEIEPAATDENRGLIGFVVRGNHEMEAIRAQLERLGMSMEPGPDPSLLWIERSEWDRRATATAIPMTDTRTRWLFGDYSQCAFADADGLERLVRRAVEEPQWRRDVIDGVAGRVKERLTIDAIAGQLIGFVQAGLGAEQPNGSAAHGA